MENRSDRSDPSTAAAEPAVIRPARSIRVVFYVVAAVVALGVLVQEVRIGGMRLSFWGFAPKFFMDLEDSVPNYLSVLMLLIAAGLLALIASTKKREADPFARHWRFLAWLFLLFSLDEAAGFHELTIEPLRLLLNAKGVLYYTWILPAAAFVLILGLVYLRFLLALPASYRVLFLLAAALHVGGAVGVEIPGGWWEYHHGKRNLMFFRIATLEETLEMAGIALFVYALLRYARSHVGEVRLRF